MRHDPINGSSSRVAEAIRSLRDKDPRSATVERLRLTWEIDRKLQGLPQPLQLGEGLYRLLDDIDVPVSPHDLVLGRIRDEVPDADGEALLQHAKESWKGRTIPPWMQDGGHECFAWDRLLSLGLPGLEAFAEAQLARQPAGDNGAGPKAFLQGALRVYRAFRNYALRYAFAARAARLTGPADACAAVAERAPATFAEGLQLVWLVAHVYCTMLARNPTLTLGRLDELLLPFYRDDLAKGRITPEQAGDLVEDFYCKNNLVLGRGEHQMSGSHGNDTGWDRNLTYDAPQYLVLGGTRKDGAAPANELTRLFLERIVPRFENPVVVFRYTPDLPEETWRLACRRMRDNASFMVYNDRAVIPAMIRGGIDPEDAISYTMHGCNWPDIPGRQRAVHTRFVLLPEHFVNAFRNLEQDAGDIDDLYAAFETLVVEQVRECCDRFREARGTWNSRAPGPLRVDDCFLHGPIEQARSWTLGGVRYPNLVLSVCGIASAADAFAAVDHLVFQTGSVRFQGLRRAVEADFCGSESLRQRCLRAAKFGQDDDRADVHAVRILQIVTEAVAAAARPGDPDGVCAFTCLETDMRHIRFGESVPATPDGRRAGEPISENTSPVPGASIKGLTAMLRSLAKLPFDRVNSGALNLRVQPRHFSGHDGLDRLASVLRAYLDMGGLQVQLSVVDTQELRDAQVHPERHRDLMVRITGYSAAFTDMAKHAQDEIIRREELTA